MHAGVVAGGEFGNELGGTRFMIAGSLGGKVGIRVMVGDGMMAGVGGRTLEGSGMG